MRALFNACSCKRRDGREKRAYPSRSEAKANVLKTTKFLEPYECREVPGVWHISSTVSTKRHRRRLKEFAA
jgi:hypothetical protein